MLGNFKINFFKKKKKNLSGIPSECQTVWIQIRPDVLSGLIWIQTVCKGYKQMTKVATSGLNSAEDKLIFFLIFPRKQDLTFHANYLNEISKPVFEK